MLCVIEKLKKRFVYVKNYGIYEKGYSLNLHSEQDRSDINLDFLLKLKAPEGYKAVSEISFNQNAEGLSCIKADNVIIKEETIGNCETRDRVPQS